MRRNACPPTVARAPSHEHAAKDRRVRLAAFGIAIAALIGVPSIARSQCAKDTDCKGARICSAGVCIDAVAKEPPRNWALAGGISGVVGAGITLGLAIPADILLDPVASTALSGAFTLTTIIQSPITAAGGRSARVATGVEGERGARVGGWIFYVVAIVALPGMIFYGLAHEEPPPHGWIVGVGIAGALSQTLLAVDAFVSHSQALALAPPTVGRPRGAGIALAPTIAPYLAPEAGNGAVFGVTGSF